MWTERIEKNPLPVLLGTNNLALLFLIERDLLNVKTNNFKLLWEMPEVKKILNHQKSDGSWHYSGKRPGEEFGEAYELLETWRTLRKLVEMYGFNCSHASINLAGEYILSYQTEEGDIRGILSNQYMPYYMGAILEILIKAGFENDERVEKGLEWLLNMRQEDGGWIVPLQLYKMNDYYRICNNPPEQPQKTLPSSHMATGMAIRAFAAHSRYRVSAKIKKTAKLLKSRIFKKDVYSSRQAVSYWYKFQYPFWWTNLVTVLDSLSWLKFSAQDVDIQKGINWIVENQGENGLWKSSYGITGTENPDYWVTFSICRILKNFLG